MLCGSVENGRVLYACAMTDEGTDEADVAGSAIRPRETYSEPRDYASQDALAAVVMGALFPRFTPFRRESVAQKGVFAKQTQAFRNAIIMHVPDTQWLTTPVITKQAWVCFAVLGSICGLLDYLQRLFSVFLMRISTSQAAVGGVRLESTSAQLTGVEDGFSL